MFAGDSSFDTLINRRMSTVDMWMHKLEASNRQGRIPMGLFRDIKRNIQDAVIHDFNLIRDEHHFFDCLPSHLQNEIIQSLFSDFKANNMQLFFEQTEQGFQNYLVVRMYCRIFEPDKIIVNFNKSVDEVYFIKQGQVRVFDKTGSNDFLILP